MVDVFAMTRTTDTVVKTNEARSPIIEHLHNEHVNIAGLLDLLETQLDAVYDGDTSALLIALDIMHYIVDYSDLFHHPTEDLIFAKLVERCPAEKTAVDTLLEEHQHLSEVGNRLAAAIRDTVSGFQLRTGVLEERGRAYVELLRRHMDTEEGRLLPLADELLTYADWTAIEAEVESRADPLFGHTVDAQFQRLYDCIQRATD